MQTPNRRSFSCGVLFYFTAIISYSLLGMSLECYWGSFINDVMQLWWEGVSQCVTQCDRWGERVVDNVVSRSGVPIIDFLPLEHRSQNSVFKISSKILTPPHPLNAKEEPVGKFPFKMLHRLVFSFNLTKFSAFKNFSKLTLYNIYYKIDQPRGGGVRQFTMSFVQGGNLVCDKV